MQAELQKSMPSEGQTSASTEAEDYVMEIFEIGNDSEGEAEE